MINSHARTPDHPQRVVVLQIPPDKLQKITTNAQAQTGKKKRKSEATRARPARRTKIGRPRRSSIERRDAVNNANPHSHPTQPRRVIWEDAEAKSIDQAFEYRLVQVSPHSTPIVFPMPVMPDGVPAGAERVIAESYYLMGEIGAKLRLPIPIGENTGPQSTTTPQRPEQRQLPGEPFPPPPREGGYWETQDAAQDEIQNALDAGYQVFPLPLPPSLAPVDRPYTTGPFQAPVQAQQPYSPLSLGQYEVNDPAYLYMVNARDNAFHPNPLTPKEPGDQLDTSMMQLNEIRHSNTQHIDPSLPAMVAGLAADSRHIDETLEFVKPIPKSRVRDSSHFVNIDAPRYRLNDTTTATLQMDPDFDSLTLPPSAMLTRQIKPLHITSPTHAFFTARILSSIRAAAKTMHTRRLKVPQYALIAASHCAQEVRFRQQEKGPFMVDERGVSLAEYDALGNVVRTLYVPGYVRAKGNQNDASEWKTVGEWRDVVRTGGRGLDEDERGRLGMTGVEATREGQVTTALRPWNTNAMAGQVRLSDPQPMWDQEIGGVRGRVAGEEMG